MRCYHASKLVADSQPCQTVYQHQCQYCRRVGWQYQEISLILEPAFIREHIAIIVKLQSVLISHYRSPHTSRMRLSKPSHCLTDVAKSCSNFSTLRMLSANFTCTKCSVPVNAYAWRKDSFTSQDLTDCWSHAILMACDTCSAACRPSTTVEQDTAWGAFGTYSHHTQSIDASN